MVSPGKRTAVFHENSDQGSNSYLELIFLQSVRHMELLVFLMTAFKHGVCHQTVICLFEE